MTDRTFVSQDPVNGKIDADWANAVNRATYSCSTVAQLRGKATPDGPIVAWVHGREAILDGGEGPWIYDSSDSVSADNTGTILTPTSGFGRWKRIKPDGRVNLKWFGTNDQAITLWLAAGKRNYAPAGIYSVGQRHDLPYVGQRIEGDGEEQSIFEKSDFNGSVFRAVDKDYVHFEGFQVAGPGQFTGTGNKGVEVIVSGQEIIKKPSFSRLKFKELNDVCLYSGTCSYAEYSSIRCEDFGFAGVYSAGGDGHSYRTVTSQNGIIGIFWDNQSGNPGNGPTTFEATGCYAEQCGVSWRLNQVRASSIRACGGEAPVDREGDNNGVLVWITGGLGNEINGFEARIDTVGVAIDPSVPLFLIDGSAAGVLLDKIDRRLHASFPAPTWEVHATAATSVRLGSHNFTNGTINSGGKVSTFDLTAIP